MINWESLKRFLFQSSPPDEEAAQQRLSKSGKIQTAIEETFSNSLEQIAQDEIADVRAYKLSKLSGVKQLPEYSKADGDAMRVIADNVTISNLKPNVLGTLAGVAAGIGLATLLWMAMKPAESSSREEVYDYGIETQVIPPEGQ